MVDIFHMAALDVMETSMICCDCKKLIWPWQRTGYDYQSHEQCHKKRTVEFFAEVDRQNAAVTAAVSKVVDEINMRRPA